MSGLPLFGSNILYSELSQDGFSATQLKDYCPTTGFSTKRMPKMVRQADQPVVRIEESQSCPSITSAPVAKKRKHMAKAGLVAEVDSDEDDLNPGSQSSASNQVEHLPRVRPKSLVVIPTLTARPVIAQRGAFGLCSKEMIQPLQTLRPIISVHVSKLRDDERCVSPSQDVKWPEPEEQLTATARMQQMKQMKDAMKSSAPKP